MIIFQGSLNINPENFYKFVRMSLISQKMQPQFTSLKSTRLFNDDANIEIELEGMPIGWASAIAFNPLTSMIEIMVNKAQGENAEKIMRQLANDILLAVTGKRIRQSGPSDTTKARYQVFEALKNGHPEWSQKIVALEYFKKFGEHINGEAVRYVYRAMGEKWEKSTKIR